MNYSTASACMSVLGIFAANRWVALACLIVAFGLLVRGHFKDRA